MKFHLIFIFIYITHILSEKTDDLFALVECNHLTSEKCDKALNRVKFTVEIEASKNETKKDSNNNMNDLFRLKVPLNTCIPEECEFCCLTTNKCGTKLQCENGKYHIHIINGIFIGLTTILFICLIIKCIQIDSYPDQKLQDKIKEEDLKHLISIFSIVKLNRKKTPS
jgi:hypothetical protein